MKTLQELNTLSMEVGAEMKYTNHEPTKFDYQVFGKDFEPAMMINAQVGESFIFTSYCETTTQRNINMVYDFLERYKNKERN